MSVRRSRFTHIPKVPQAKCLTASPSQKDVVISFNPNSGATDRRAIVKEVHEALADQGYRVHVPESVEELWAVATRLFEDDALRTIVAAGGDGTVSLLANQLPQGVPITVFPLGTENLLAKYLTLDTRIDRMLETIAQGHSVLLDVGRANGTFFLVMASCGFDADVVRRLHRNRRGHIRHWSYAAPIFGSMGQYRFPKIRVYLDGESSPSLEPKWAFIFNAPRYAMNLPIVEDADTMDGMLDLCTFRGGNVLQGLMYVAGVSLRRHHAWNDCVMRKVKKLVLESDGEVPYQLDGDPGGILPLEIEVVPSFLRVLLPPSQVELEEISDE